LVNTTSPELSASWRSWEIAVDNVLVAFTRVEIIANGKATQVDERFDLCSLAGGKTEHVHNRLQHSQVFQMIPQDLSVSDVIIWVFEFCEPCLNLFELGSLMRKVDV
jgi:hypothetical protein